MTLYNLHDKTSAMATAATGRIAYAAKYDPCCPLLNHFEHTPFAPRQFPAVTCRRDVVRKPEVHNVSQRHQKRPSCGRS